MLADKIWHYIGSRVDDGVLPDEDEIYLEFVEYFERYGWNPEIVEKTVLSYCDCSDLNGVEIKWEGEIPWKPIKELLRTETTILNKSKKIS